LERSAKNQIKSNQIKSNQIKSNHQSKSSIMLKLITTLTVFLFGILAKGQNTETRTITDFNKMEVKNAKVIYTQSNQSSLTIASEYNDTPETILTEVVNGT
jgi:DNA-directed RNA polymerase subunit M/transcription elongation factor TFIIS